MDILFTHILAWALASKTLIAKLQGEIKSYPDVKCWYDMSVMVYL